MTLKEWNVELVGQAKKFPKNLSENACDSFGALLLELRILGPHRSGWPNYSKLKGHLDSFHCHVEKGRPTYVVCWRVVNKREKLIEVYYAGTHEKAPY